MSSTYAEPAQMDGAQGSYANHSDTPSAQQPQPQEQHMTDPELRLQESMQQLRDGGDMMHAHQQPQYQHITQMPPAMGAHAHFQSPARPTHSPQQMAHAVMSLEGQHDIYDPNDPNRKRSKVSRACDECRRKKVRERKPFNEGSTLTDCRSAATRRARTDRKPAQVARGRERDVSSVDNR
jgi:hypothetical protein